MAPRTVVVSLASDFGCQVQMTNIEDDLLAVLGLIDLGYWQLASSGHMPEEYDVAIVEGAVTTSEHVQILKDVRQKASVVIAIGACAVLGGIPALASSGELEDRVGCVYGDDGALVACGRLAPAGVSSVIDVDYRVPGCPIDTSEFIAVLQRALMGLSDRLPTQPMCAACKMAENECFFEHGQVCLGLVTRSGCGARCISLGRPCSGCRGLAEDAHPAAARAIYIAAGFGEDALVDRYRLYNTAEEASLT